MKRSLLSNVSSHLLPTEMPRSGYQQPSLKRSLSYLPRVGCSLVSLPGPEPLPCIPKARTDNTRKGGERKHNTKATDSRSQADKHHGLRSQQTLSGRKAYWKNWYLPFSVRKPPGPQRNNVYSSLKHKPREIKTMPARRK